MCRSVVSNVSTLSSGVANDNQPCITFPAPPLKFRTAGFPQYGFKAGLSDGAFLPKRTVCLRPSCSPWRHKLFRSESEFIHSVWHHRSSDTSLYPRGPRSDAGYVVPHHHHLIGLICPTCRHIEISPHCGLYPMPSLGDNRLGPQVVPCFRCMFLLDMPSSRSPESSSVILTQSLHRRHWPSPRGGNGSALSIFPTLRFPRGALISGCVRVRFRYGLSSC